MNFKSIIIEYHYLDVPAPFCYTKTLKIKATDTALQADYLLEYTDREEFSQDELEEEGFTGEDNESWKGDLHINWLDTLKSLTDNSVGEKATSANECIVYVDGTLLETYGNESKWDYFIQEITQAIYETATWEQPLAIRYCKKESNSDKAPIKKLQISFASKSASISPAEKNAKTIQWETIQQLLKLYYLQEFREDNHSNKVPNQTGVYTDPSDGLWYDIKGSASALAKVQREELSNVLEELFA